MLVAFLLGPGRRSGVRLGQVHASLLRPRSIATSRSAACRRRRPAQAHALSPAQPRPPPGRRASARDGLHRHRPFNSRPGRARLRVPPSGASRCRDSAGRSTLQRPRRARRPGQPADRQPAGALRPRAARSPRAHRRGPAPRARRSTIAPTATDLDRGTVTQLPASTVDRTRPEHTVLPSGCRRTKPRLDSPRSAPTGCPRRNPSSSTEILTGDHLTSLPVLLLGGAAALSIVTRRPRRGRSSWPWSPPTPPSATSPNAAWSACSTSLQQTAAAAALVRRDGAETSLPASGLVPGDVLLLKAGHDVPADAPAHRGRGPERRRVGAHRRERARGQGRTALGRRQRRARRPRQHGARRHRGRRGLRAGGRHRRPAATPRSAGSGRS